MKPVILRDEPICSADGDTLALRGYTYTCPTCGYRWDASDRSGTYGTPPMSTDPVTLARRAGA